MKRIAPDVARRFYAEHEGKGFFGELVSYITSGPVLAVQVAGENAQPRLRELVGKTNPKDASPGTLRYMYGTSLQENAVHASTVRRRRGTRAGDYFRLGRGASPALNAVCEAASSSTRSRGRPLCRVRERVAEKRGSPNRCRT
jgi:hypothetical protein